MIGRCRLHVTLALAACLASAPTACKPETPGAQGMIAVAGGRRLHYEVYGNGPDTVLVVHGGPGLHARYLVSPLRGLRDGRTLIYYDQRARGLSDPEPDSLALSPDTDIADLDSVRAHFKLQSVALIGHHYGGLLAARYTVAHPDRVRRLLLVSPYFAGPAFLWLASLQGKDTAATNRFVAARRAQLDQREPAQFCREEWGWWFSPAEVTDPDVVRQLAGDICAAPDDKLRYVSQLNRLVLSHLGKPYTSADSAITTPMLVLEGTGSKLDQSGRHWAKISTHGLFQQVAGPELFPWAGGSKPFTEAADRFLRQPAPSVATAAPRQ